MCSGDVAFCQITLPSLVHFVLQISTDILMNLHMTWSSMLDGCRGHQHLIHVVHL